MKASEIITILVDLINQYGDLELYYKESPDYNDIINDISFQKAEKKEFFAYDCARKTTIEEYPDRFLME
jgi:hypothetical protein